MKPNRAHKEKKTNVCDLSLVEWACEHPALVSWYNQVDAIDEESREEGYKLCGDAVKANAKQVLQRIAQQYLDDKLTFDIYPTEEQDIHIWCRPRLGYGLLTLCEPSGKVYCNLATRHTNERFCSNINEFEFSKLWKMFKEIGFPSKATPCFPIDNENEYELSNRLSNESIENHSSNQIYSKLAA